MSYCIGFDIGGTKCAVSLGEIMDGNIRVLHRQETPTVATAQETLSVLAPFVKEWVKKYGVTKAGISCGGPLSSEKGLIVSTPNLPQGWHGFYIVQYVKEEFGLSAKLQNDANACAVAEWKFGAGKGCDNVVFMTFGTGLGAGLILDGKLYSGTNDNAGELGHIRLDRFGPVGFGKAGSFEGFCSGGGIAQLGYTLAMEKVQMGSYPAYFTKGMTAADVTAKSIAEAAYAGDQTAIEVYRTCGEYLGRGLSIVIDLLNPQVIVIGSVFARSRDLLWEAAKTVIDREALTDAVRCCRVVPAGLGEHIGDYAAVATALL